MWVTGPKAKWAAVISFLESPVPFSPEREAQAKAPSGEGCGSPPATEDVRM